MSYADDLVLLTELQNELRSLFSQLEKSSARIGLRANEEKTKCMFVKRQTNAIRLRLSLCTGHYNFGRVDQFKYLGMILTENNEMTKAIKVKIQTGQKLFFGIAKLLELDPCQEI